MALREEPDESRIRTSLPYSSTQLLVSGQLQSKNAEIAALEEKKVAD